MEIGTKKGESNSLNMNRFFFSLLILNLGIQLTYCSPTDRPKNSYVLDQVLKGEKISSPNIVFSRKINLDEKPDLEVIYLVRNGQSETVAVFKRTGEEWKMEWKKSFSLMNIGPLEYKSEDSKWVPVKEEKPNQGFIVKKMIAQELPGDSFNTIFMEVMSEEPPLGLFSFPIGYRKGQKVLDGLRVLKDHPKLKTGKRGDFEYKPEDKSILVFPNDRNMSLEFVFNGREMIPNLSSQPIPSILSFSQKENNRYRIEFKNRGGFNTTTYITLSFPGEGKLQTLSDTKEVRAYSKGDSVFSKVHDRFVPAEYPMIEATKASWGRNVRYAFEFEYTGEAKTALIRSSYRYNRNVETIPNEYSIAPTAIDQQGFSAYPISLPETSTDSGTNTEKKNNKSETTNP